MKIKGLWLRGETYWFRAMRHGKRRVWNLQTGDLAAAIAKAADLLRGIDTEPAGLLRLELDFALDCRNRIREKTRSGQASVAKIFCEWAGGVTSNQITRDDVARWLEDLQEAGKSSATVHSYARTMRSLFGCLIREKRLAANPFSRPDLKKMGRSPRRDFCSVATRDKIIAAATGDMKTILLLGFHAGLRKNEIVEARPEWIDHKQGVIHVCKTATFTPKDGDDRTIPLSRELKAHLATLPTPFLVQPDVPHGRAEYRYDFRHPFRLHMEACGHPEITAHTMRRTFASLLVSAGVSIYKVSKWLGDGVEVVTDSYGHLIAYDSEIDLPSGQPSKRTRSTARSKSRRS
jgi:integrase